LDLGFGFWVLGFGIGFGTGLVSMHCNVMDLHSRNYTWVRVGVRVRESMYLICCSLCLLR
jgi:hypothetical protein